MVAPAFVRSEKNGSVPTFLRRSQKTNPCDLVELYELMSKHCEWQCVTFWPARPVCTTYIGVNEVESSHHERLGTYCRFYCKTLLCLLHSPFVGYAWLTLAYSLRNGRRADRFSILCYIWKTSARFLSCIAWGSKLQHNNRRIPADDEAQNPVRPSKCNVYTNN